MIERDTLHRLVKAVVDSGRAPSFLEGEQFLERLSVNVYVGSNIEKSRSLQAALATVINTARRSFLGGVNIIADSNYNVMIPWSDRKNLFDLCEELGPTHYNQLNLDAPTIVIGDYDEDEVQGACRFKVTFDQWTAGVIPFGETPLPERDIFPLAGALAGALSVSEAFQFVWGQNAYAGRRPIFLSLWSAQSDVDNQPIPERIMLPNNLWVLGLGHLGQAAIWMLGFLPYEKPETVRIVLQDDESISVSNDSTCLLTTRHAVGWKKTRWVANLCDKLGFQTVICERRLESGLILNDNDPKICFLLPDNIAARNAIEKVDFKYVIEAGIGSTKYTFLQFALHTFPGHVEPSNVWKEEKQKELQTSSLPSAYSDLFKIGMDECGIQLIAGIAIGAPFVGAIVSCFVVAEAIRILNGGPLFDNIRGNLASPKHIKRIEKRQVPEPYNYGITPSI